MSGLLVVGAGPGIGTSVARRFGTAGMRVGLVARSQASIDAALATLAGAGVERAAGATADAAREPELRGALDRLTDLHGVPDVVVYNAGLIRADRPGELDYDGHRHAYAVNVLGALATAAHLAPRWARPAAAP